MAFDTKRLKAFKWLEKIATKPQRNVKGLSYNPYQDIYIRFGRLYATNGFILAEVEYPEFAHCGDDAWKSVVTYVDANGTHLETIEYTETEQTERMRDRLFSDMFPSKLHYDQCQPFNPYLLAECMYLFKLYNINPIISLDDAWIMFSGHNNDVSIRVLTLGFIRR